MNFEIMWESKKTNVQCWRKSVHSCLCNVTYNEKWNTRKEVFSKIHKNHKSDIEQKDNLTPICFKIKWSDFKEWHCNIKLEYCNKQLIIFYHRRISFKTLKKKFFFFAVKFMRNKQLWNNTDIVLSFFEWIHMKRLIELKHV